LRGGDAVSSLPGGENVRTEKPVLGKKPKKKALLKKGARHGTGKPFDLSPTNLGGGNMPVRRKRPTEV